MSQQAIEWAVHQRLPSVPKVVLLALAYVHDGDTNTCQITPRLMGRLTGATQHSYETHIAKLTKLDLIDVLAIPPNTYWFKLRFETDYGYTNR